ncbi:sugar O-acetyltransferase [Pontibacillus sp. HMF3514]|uniref:sugar O-acetyltransferase n=1 Tax=Pontibacillus sp. HMF3514 TaxID=2692425 RepID=UPI00131F49E4|nr:sugar O-acetyltransferase [Pontibacillus sp. HMF3514]QHE53999.1 maltose O-acetyltransferase [Pontibacillus sp. HMF3514]
MTEKEKMIVGELYNPQDQELFQDRLRAKSLCKKINDLDPTKLDERVDLLKELFQIDHNVIVEPGFYCDYGYNIHPGKNFYANHQCVILDCCPVNMGDNVMFGPGVQVLTADHPINAQARISGTEMASPITVGDNVWIGGGAILLPGVTIGSNTVIGAGSVVNKDIPDNVVAVGNPCKVKKQIED